MPANLFPDWGPYTKKYSGLSYLPHTNVSNPRSDHKPSPYQPLTAAAGLRLDISTVPALQFSGQPLPNVTIPGTCHPWLTLPDYSEVTYRFELGHGPSEQLYADVLYRQLDDGRILVRTTFVNHTERAREGIINCFAGISWPLDAVCRAVCPDGVIQLPAQDYEAIHFARPRPWQGQVPDSERTAVFRDRSFTDGFGLGDRVALAPGSQTWEPFGLRDGDRVSYRLPDSLVDTPADPALLIRYRTVSPGEQMVDNGCRLALALQDKTWSASILLEASDELATCLIPLDAAKGCLRAGQPLSLTALGSGLGIELDALFIGTVDTLAGVRFERHDYDYEAAVYHSEKGYILSWAEADVSCHLVPHTASSRLRRLASGRLEDAQPARLTNPHFSFDELTEPFSSSFPGTTGQPGWYADIVMPSLLLPAGEERSFDLIVEARRGCEAFRGTDDGPVAADSEVGLIDRALGRRHETGLMPIKDRQDNQLNRLTWQDINPAGNAFSGAMQRLSATLLQNVVYPTFTKNGWLIHYSPGKRWDNLYSWDAGFIGLGLLTLDRNLAEYMLDLYLAPPDDPEQAFVHHGSPVPVQIPLLWELVNGQISSEQARLLRLYYGRARLYVDFLAGRTHNSRTSPFSSGLTTTYAYFYNASGMDDYPAQLLTHLKGLQSQVSPVISTAQVILAQRLLRHLAELALTLPAEETGLSHEELQDDILRFEASGNELSHALESWAWDEGSGYYGYVLHDRDGRPTGILRTAEGLNLNCGFDGIYPLVDGRGANPHWDVLVSHLKSEDELLTPYGLTAVSRRAPYFSSEGYWNGTVWFAHAWYFGRALLDYGEGSFLYDLVRRQLQAYSGVSDASWTTPELLRLTTGQGGWHQQFSGLSSPLLNWAAACYLPGQVTCGFSALLAERHFDPEAGTLSFIVFHQGAGSLQTWACLPAQEAHGLLCRIRAVEISGRRGFQVSFSRSGNGAGAGVDFAETNIDAMLEQLDVGLWQLTIESRPADLELRL